MGGDAAQAAPAQPRRGSRITEDWTPSAKARADLRAKYPAYGRDWWLLETEKFINHFLAKSGRDAAKLDWDRAFRNWIHGAVERSAGPAGSQVPGQQSKAWSFMDQSQDPPDRQTA